MIHATLDRCQLLRSRVTPRHFGSSLSFYGAIAVCSAWAWSGRYIWLLPLSLVFPVALGLRQSSQWGLLRVAGSYYLGALWPIVPGARAFFGHHTVAGGVILLLGAVLILSIPFFVIPCFPSHLRITATLVILVGEALSPFGLASPLTVAGLFFPYLSITGLVAMGLVMLAAIARCYRAGWAVILAGGIISSLVQMVVPNPGEIYGWSAHDTHIAGADNSWVWSQTKNANAMLNLVSASSAVNLYPEGVIRGWTPGVSDAMLSQAAKIRLRAPNTLVFGAERQAGSKRIPVVIAISLSAGSKPVYSEYRARIPVPVAEWGKDVDLNIQGSGILPVDGYAAGILLCYEQLLVLPVLRSFLEGADVIVAPSNLYWAKGTNISAVQDMCVRAWSRLFAVHYYRMVNE